MSTLIMYNMKASTEKITMVIIQIKEKEIKDGRQEYIIY